MHQENRLAKETSPYLQQHKHNPVDWFPWGEAALQKAKDEDKPICLSIGYSSCHWCHVMAHESFEDEETALLMNRLFINIKVDREERPDLDEIYIDAVQLMTQSAGWPLTVFLTPQGTPFFGGTYFPLERKYGQISFKEVLNAVALFYRENKEKAFAQAEQLVHHMRLQATEFNLVNLELDLNDNALNSDKIVQSLLPNYEKLLSDLDLDADKKNGGFGGAPKFPQPAKIAAFLFSGKKNLVAQSILTLKNIACGGITDHIEGGIARYSVDSTWLVPHFEKMLYDNAQLLPLFASASALIKENNAEISELLSNTSRSIFSYLESLLKDEKTGLYFAAEDADSEGEEGLFYTYFYDDFCALFSQDKKLQEFAVAYFKVTERGNFEGTNILTLPSQFAEFCRAQNISEDKGQEMRSQVVNILQQDRKNRLRPHRDEKCLLSWNALAATGLLKASLALEDSLLAQRALEILSQILKIFKTEEGYNHTYYQGEVKIAAFCDDLAFLLEALTHAFALTGSVELLKESLEIIKTIHKNFVDPISGVLYYARPQEELIVRPFIPEDNVIYSAHSAIIGSVQQLLGIVTAQDREEKFLSFADIKMCESLELIALANIARTSQKVPTLFANGLQKAKWREKKNILILSAAAEPLNFSRFSREMPRLKNMNFTYIGNTINTTFTLAQHHLFFKETSQQAESTFSFCNANGCYLPTHAIEEIIQSS